MFILDVQQAIGRCPKCFFRFGVGMNGNELTLCNHKGEEHEHVSNPTMGKKQLRQLNDLCALRRLLELVTSAEFRDSIDTNTHLKHLLVNGDLSRTWLEIKNKKYDELPLDPLLCLHICALYEALVLDLFQYLMRANGLFETIASKVVNSIGVRNLKERHFGDLVWLASDPPEKTTWKKAVIALEYEWLENRICGENGFFTFRNGLLHGKYTPWHGGSIQDDEVIKLATGIYDFTAKLNNLYVVPVFGKRKLAQ